MKWNQAMMMTLALLLSGGNVMAQGAKSPPVIKEAGKGQTATMQGQPVSGKKETVKKSPNPDSMEFVGASAVVKDPGRP